MTSKEKNMSYLLSKVFGVSQYADDFLDGKIYINALTSFGIGNLAKPFTSMSNRYRGDLNEGRSSAINSEEVQQNVRLRNFLIESGILNNQDELDGKVVGEFDSLFLTRYVLSLLMIDYDATCEVFLLPDEQMRQFDDEGKGKAIIIHKPNVFLRRLTDAIASAAGSQYWVGYGPVKYYSKNDSYSELDEFSKTDDYVWQKEFRVSLDFGSNSFKTYSDCFNYDSEHNAVIIDIGDLRDIAFDIGTEDFLKLKVPDNQRFAITTKPLPIVPFYPPFQCKTTFACPVIKKENRTYIAKALLYPILRNPENYLINLKFVRNLDECKPENDANFLYVTNKYFNTMLKISKMLYGLNGLGPLLTSIANYMMHINCYEMAGVRMSEDESGVSFVFDYTLLEISNNHQNKIDSYRTIIFQGINPKKTDFAECVANSDDTDFPEYEYNGKRYVRVVVNQNMLLSSGLYVKKDEPVWIEVARIERYEIND